MIWFGLFGYYDLIWPVWVLWLGLTYLSTTYDLACLSTSMTLWGLFEYYDLVGRSVVCGRLLVVTLLGNLITRPTTLQLTVQHTVQCRARHNALILSAMNSDDVKHSIVSRVPLGGPMQWGNKQKDHGWMVRYWPRQMLAFFPYAFSYAHYHRHCQINMIIKISSSTGMNQLLWYYADLEKKRCMEDVEKNRYWYGIILLSYRSIIAHWMLILYTN